MDLLAVAVGAICLLVGAVLGVVLHKYVIAEAKSVKEHVTAEISSTEGRLRTDITDALHKFASKL